MATILTDESKILLMQKRMQLSALYLEAMGMKHSRGKSICKHIKDTYGIKGRSKTDVYKKFHAMILEEEEAMGMEHRPLTVSEKKMLGEV